MKKIIGSVAIFLATYIFLSINLQNKPVFHHIYKYSSPLTHELQKKVEYIVKFGFDGSKSFGSKIFHNSIPHSSSKNKSLKKPLEDVTEKEQKELNDLIK